MAQVNEIKQTQQPSALATFKLGFEYDITWAAVHKQYKK